METWPLLSIVTFAPLVGALLILVMVRGDREATDRNARWLALWASLATFLISLLIWINFETGTADFQFVEKVAWFSFPGGYTLSYHMGVDGISMMFVLLSTLLTPICILCSWEIKSRVREFMAAFLVLETFMVGTFCALDLVTFYVFFEGVLLPMFLIIGVWGGDRRVYSAFKFFLYTLLGSVLMLVAVMAMYFLSKSAGQGTTDIVELLRFARETGFSPEAQTWLWLAFFASFAVKLPMWPVHTWLPDAHVEAPTAGSVILAGVLLKMGGYGFLRFSLPMFPDASVYFAPLVYTLSIVAIIYTSLVALAQEDMKKLIAYSSVAHMGFVTLGIFAATVQFSAGSLPDNLLGEQAVTGAMFQMLSHGIVSAALFLCVGVVYDRLHTRRIDRYGGLVHRMPRYAAVFMVFTLASVGLPGTSGFIGEFLVLFGVFQVNVWAAALAATGVILGAAYMLWLYRRIIFGELVKPDLMRMKDLHPREVAIFAPLVILVLWMGIWPEPFLDVFDASVKNLLTSFKAGACRVNEACFAAR
ncbi:MAG: NADH-quinone oxidoreductase subunit M [Rhodospirillaceae bacterium]|nr:NADH-quinone oxidoreductase subunit M [Rhodospirillaceae bacterium]MYF87339.1 NADH-quinone oxidoreductase subunit M [Rhodospirillaceae bacterium]MYH38985.1 NADH-quinone oxidoreductase subunit M [Rhodospirillaceae bacterium]MYK14857.1 NADH-quinone oxidoreductase subunit M [Rhodospirillaceae bacterium]MYK59871.1 NADH-quinone oxidoreductase subunit M [Rhodospirillaceae bacterium]